MCIIRPERRDKGLDPCTTHGSLLTNRLPQTRASHPIPKGRLDKAIVDKTLLASAPARRSLVLERYFEDEIVGSAARSSASHSRRARWMICVRARKASLVCSRHCHPREEHPPPEAALVSEFPKYADLADKC